MWPLILFWRRETWRAFWRRPLVYVPALMAAALLALGWYTAAQVLQLETVIMRYSIYIGTNWLAPAKSILLLPAVATVMVVADLYLSYLVSRASLALRYLWLWSAVFIAAGFYWLTWLLLRINS